MESECEVTEKLVRVSSCASNSASVPPEWHDLWAMVCLLLPVPPSGEQSSGPSGRGGCACVQRKGLVSLHMP